MSTEFELFPGKNLGDLFKDIYENQQTKKLRISELIAEMRKLVRHAPDMMAMGPIIRDLIDSAVKNDDSLIKMAAIAQRIIGANQASDGDSGFLSDAEKEQLLQQFDESLKEVGAENDIKVDDLTNEIEELKQKVNNE
jgi:hypothetical protein|tara:strand:- start:188 stop:601 length:414 start_codon:yes stop_codon:yes gene_type:complete